MSGLPPKADIPEYCRHVAKCHYRTHAPQQNMCDVARYPISSSARTSSAVGLGDVDDMLAVDHVHILDRAPIQPPVLLWPKPFDLRLERGFDRPVRRLNGDHARPCIGDTASLADALNLRTLLREFASAQD